MIRGLIEMILGLIKWGIYLTVGFFLLFGIGIFGSALYDDLFGSQEHFWTSLIVVGMLIIIGIGWTMKIVSGDAFLSEAERKRKVRRNERLAQIERKTRRGEDLTEDELNFVIRQYREMWDQKGMDYTKDDLEDLRWELQGKNPRHERQRREAIERNEWIKKQWKRKTE